MAKQDQKIIIAPPSSTDLANGLQDFSSTIQQTFETAFTLIHTHLVKTSIPLENSGTVGDIQLVEINGAQYLYVRFPSGWQKFIPA